MRDDEAIVYVDRSAIRPGKLDELIAALRDLAALVEREEDQIVSYQVHLDEARSTISVVHIHAAGGSLDRHLAIAGPAFPKFAALVDLQAIDVYGSPSESAIAGLRQKAALLGAATVTIHPRAAGFARLGPRGTAAGGSEQGGGIAAVLGAYGSPSRASLPSAISFVDRVSMDLMACYGVTAALALDPAFAQSGVTVLPPLTALGTQTGRPGS